MMKTKITKTMLAFSAVATLLCSGSAVNAQTITNAEFNILDNSTLWTTGTRDGWTKNDSLLPQNNTIGFSAGEREGLPGPMWYNWTAGENVSQTITDLVIGDTYQFSIDAANTRNANNSLFFDVDGGQKVSFDLGAIDTTWTTYSYEFTATSTSHDLRFGHDPDAPVFAEAMQIRNNSGAFANVSVPEPSSTLLLGLGGLGFLARRRR